MRRVWRDKLFVCKVKGRRLFVVLIVAFTVVEEFKYGLPMIQALSIGEPRQLFHLVLRMYRYFCMSVYMVV